PTGRPAPAARRRGPAGPRSPAARTPAPPRRVPAAPPRIPPSAQGLRVAGTLTTTHALAVPHFRRFWVQPAIMRHDPGLAASPPPCYRLKVERTGALSFLLLRSARPAPAGLVWLLMRPAGRRPRT